MTAPASSPIPLSWDRQRVREASPPTSEGLAEESTAWLYLDGARIGKPDDALAALLKDFASVWLWRGTDREYAAAGYRAGPLLTPLTAAVLESFRSTWAAQGIGLILLSPASSAELVAHLQRLTSLPTAEGEQLSFSLGDTRRLEELGEGLGAQTLAKLLGPVSTVIWPNENPDAPSWWRLDNPMSQPNVSEGRDALVLTTEDEVGLTRARRDSFLRRAATELIATLPGHCAVLGPAELERQLTTFASEAEQLQITRESDARRYLGLRLRYPQAPFVQDTVLRKHLSDLRIDARQRMCELEHRLRTVYTPSP